MSIEQSHIIDDLAIEVGDLKRRRDRAVRLLNDANSALAAGDLHVVAEFIERSLGYLTK